MVAISLDYAAPDCALKDFVSVFYEFRADVPVFEDLERADLAQFRFKLSPGPGEYRFADGHIQAAPDIQIMGPTTGMTHVRVEGPVHVFGAGLLPAGWAALLGIEASTMLNRVLDATELFGKGLYQVADQFRAAETLEQRVAIGNRLADDLARNARELPFWFTRTVDAWLSDTLSPEVIDLVKATGLSRRQVERYCKRFYGAPPKLLARKYRALRAAVALAKGETDVDKLLEQGFYDQSHFIREIKQFTGITPKRFAEDLPTLARLTLKRGDLAGQVGPLVSDT
ncbi:MAG: AraC family transcriptional regulator [Sphingomonas sp. SCN 67-18]|uniref:AraC family transcriptional regulator n=1 Tax=uncultured Sphingomonas sp. TaxID=158754 RepID=UPI00086EC211|nr:AraC family transcriptional regulator [Sphingomonas sp. SCN 67-18]ODU21775.1 MAG: AraC family transcriptional regulator [Sphingomonas sp. SCN 67-18]